MSVVEVCGCINDTDLNTGIDFCVSKCESHIAYSRTAPRRVLYYVKTKTIDIHGKPIPSLHVGQMKEALGEFPLQSTLFGLPVAFEIGGGTSPYARSLEDAGYTYLGVDSDAWAAEWMMRTYNMNVLCGKFPNITKGMRPDQFPLILSAHSLEHMPNALTALHEGYRLLQPGGLCYLLVPEGTDRTNPDHYWFFKMDTLSAYLEKIGFKIEASAQRNFTPVEDYLFIRATK